ncbi:MAG TPA: L-serine ammonia-lyase, iron-sulfur-dependent subunit beta [Cyclobacteriaceae bacterium]|nr:L-serine ammonia-lyase, iron-sulfur-dependent subunit beta [Cyclobacteriaceae bacterium]HMV08866.1 L-serine ammonia-lyase, iron-sulfur-dependent subunit beta [Cyclobacteriaceae bacterium]HMV89291.1 L-serine ammonia-lyase, iron-sulfur-dependent subunit beta [Cyclobacteriaceae bacterium]HMX00379.1 L-serine ammonia-lyase, iron-sulfur-dependent subunit beta [Cyclobacteriaceae bacterium]HMX49622.1 L-serine ammonia-lyase, iron-sulfur-dependent subunit beta [Cyclobacteriaceae bacterium]
MPEKSSVFDMIGPVMIGPSSSHTAGVVRIARTALKLLGGVPEEADIIFYNSFARTYEGHGSDRAIIAGLLDYRTDDKRIKDSLELAKENNLKYTFKSIGNASALHPNTIRLNLKLGDKKIEVLGESKGGGVINIAEVNGFKADFSASLHTLIIFADDVKGSIAFLANVLAHDDCNIATMSVSRKGKNDLACLVIEMDSGVKPVTLAYVRSLSWVKEVIYIPDIDR